MRTAELFGTSSAANWYRIDERREDITEGGETLCNVASMSRMRDDGSGRENGKVRAGL